MKVDIYSSKNQTKKVTAKKTIAAIIPNYNYADFLTERIDSVLFQTYPISELIILDDASPDNSVEVIEKKIRSIKQNYPEIKVKFLKNEVNSGGCVFSQWQKGLKEAKSDYFWIAEADDSADPHFLETAMTKFEEKPNTVLFYSDSYRINQFNEITSKTCSDWADMWKSGRFGEDYYNSGEDEVKNYFSGTNIILNVSCVVWKNSPELPKIFEEAKDYKVAGDWYIYSRVLEQGDIAYSAKQLNYYRKHDKGSASTVVKLNTEYGEVVKVQERIIKKYKLGNDKVEWAKVRRRGMGFVENEKNGGKRGSIAWLIPSFSAGSGGHRTIFTNVNFLIENGYRCDLYINGNPGEYPNDIYKRIVEGYGECKADVFAGYTLAHQNYDAVFATGWDTAGPVADSNIKNKLYFIQDFEPYFFPRNGENIAAERSYSLGLRGITIGRWLTQKISNNYPTKTNFFHFCADSSKYFEKPNIEREDAICYIFQPGKPRRCDSIALRALQIVQKLRPETKIYLYGSAKRKVDNLEATHLGVISVEECNDLYNKSSVGLCMSASNPSRIPFEMMSAGLPVVELYLDNNIYDFPEGGCLLADPTPEAVAAALLDILNSKKKQETMSKSGLDYMKDYPIEVGYKEFLAFVDAVISGKTPAPAGKLEATYSSPAFKATDETRNAVKKLPPLTHVDPSPSTTELIKRGIRIVGSRTKRFAKNKLRSIYHRIKH